MKTKYYAWKDGKQTEGKQDWIELTPSQFIEICNKNRELAQEERRYFYQLPGLEEGDYYLYLECTYEQYKLSRAEKEVRARRRKEREELIAKGQWYGIVSIDSVIEDSSEDTCTYHDLIPDPESDFEDDIILSMDVRNALNMLSSGELEIIESLYLAEYAVTERKLAQKMGISKTALHYRKEKIFEKIRKSLDQN